MRKKWITNKQSFEDGSAILALSFEYFNSMIGPLPVVEADSVSMNTTFDMGLGVEVHLSILKTKLTVLNCKVMRASRIQLLLSRLFYRNRWAMMHQLVFSMRHGGLSIEAHNKWKLNQTKGGGL